MELVRKSEYISNRPFLSANITRVNRVFRAALRAASINSLAEVVEPLGSYATLVTAPEESIVTRITTLPCLFPGYDGRGKSPTKFLFFRLSEKPLSTSEFGLTLFGESEVLENTHFLYYLQKEVMEIYNDSTRGELFYFYLSRLHIASFQYFPL